MKKKLLFLLGLVMGLSLTNVYAVDNVTKINTSSALVTCLKTEGSNCVLAKNIYFDSFPNGTYVEPANNVTLSLNGYKLEMKYQNQGIFRVKSGVLFNISDDSENKSGVLYNSYNAAVPAIIVDGGRLIINGGTIKAYGNALEVKGAKVKDVLIYRAKFMTLAKTVSRTAYTIIWTNKPSATTTISDLLPNDNDYTFVNDKVTSFNIGLDATTSYIPNTLDQIEVVDATQRDEQSYIVIIDPNGGIASIDNIPMKLNNILYFSSDMVIAPEGYEVDYIRVNSVRYLFKTGAVTIPVQIKGNTLIKVIYRVRGTAATTEDDPDVDEPTTPTEPETPNEEQDNSTFEVLEAPTDKIPYKSTKDITFKIKARTDKIYKIYMDNKLLSVNKDYELNGGNENKISDITLKGSFIVSLSTGSHTFKVYYNNNSSTYKQVTIKIFVAIPINAAIITTTSQYYTGKAIKYNPSIKYANKTLKLNTDYKITYKDNVNLGTAYIKIEGINNYNGVAITSFQIIIPPAKGLAKSAQGKDYLTVKWTKNAAVDGTEVWYSTSKTGTYKKLAIVTGASTVSYKKTGLKPGTTYFFKVRHYKTIGKTKYYGAFSAILETGTKPDKVKIKTPTQSGGVVTVKWSKATGSGYELEYSTKKTSGYSILTTLTSSSKVSFSKKLTKGKTYYFRIRAYKTINGKKVYGAYSDKVSIKIK